MGECLSCLSQALKSVQQHIDLSKSLSKYVRENHEEKNCVVGVNVTRSVSIAMKFAKEILSSKCDAKDWTRGKDVILTSFLLSLLGKCVASLSRREDRSCLSKDLAALILSVGLRPDQVLCHPFRLRHWVSVMKHSSLR